MFDSRLRVIEGRNGIVRSLLSLKLHKVKVKKENQPEKVHRIVE